METLVLVAPLFAAAGYSLIYLRVEAVFSARS
jgi:hypothetical protein